MTIGDVREQLTGFSEDSQVIIDDCGQTLDFRIVNDGGVCKIILLPLDEEDDFDDTLSYSSEDEMLSEDAYDNILDEIDEKTL